MRKPLLTCVAAALVLSSLACSVSMADNPTPTLLFLPSPTPALASATSQPATATSTLALPSPTVAPATPTTAVASATAPAASSATSPSGVTTPGAPSGPYAVLLVSTGDTLNVRSGPDASTAAIGSFTATANNVMRTGPSTLAASDLWVQVQNPGGGTGWVNAHYLTEYVPSATFCADARVNTLITSLGTAFTAGNGVLLQSLVSPTHGMTVYLWRSGNPVTFAAADSRWVFESTFSHDWGASPGSGLEANGSFHVVVLPKLQEVFNASYTLNCDIPGVAASFSSQPWPSEYTNVNYYGIYKPGTAGVDLDWRLWLVGVEYVQGQPYVFSLIHFEWEP